MPCCSDDCKWYVDFWDEVNGRLYHDGEVCDHPKRDVNDDKSREEFGKYFLKGVNCPYYNKKEDEYGIY